MNILDLGRDGLEKLLIDLGEKPYRASQIFQWIYQKGITDFSEMSNIEKNLCKRLKSIASINYPLLIDRLISEDGTEKLAYQLLDGSIIESVLIPEDNHWTICVSTQVGCPMGCKFCYTASMGFIRNLNVGEIVSQVLYPIKAFRAKRISNVVFMGMGEPLLNYNNVARAVHIIRNPLGPGISKRRITVSTCGIVPKISKIWHDTGAQLAVSLNAPTDKQRDALMPINKRYPLKALLDTLKNYPLPRRCHITIEYVMLRDINDSIDDAKNLFIILRGIRTKINLIPFNPWPGAIFDAPKTQDVLAFQEYLLARGIAVMVRKEKGRDIMAACGQLAGGNI
ncbi:MAG: 23S rRNA (adenine(2503)-C(2))-methyltransferase RlmN [Deltaproteobacteria bacterium]|nr:23S rRNA (adenine(2503)-C(2))-methyltransferase RlmN [Deltaproteobacteria bacterium]